MPQLAIKHGYLREKYRLHAQSLEVATLLYWVGSVPVQKAALVGVTYYAYSSYTR